MSAIRERIHRQARLRPQRLLLAEGGDERVVRGADRLARERLAEVGVIGAPGEIRAAARRAGAALEGVALLDAAAEPEVARTLQALAAARGERLAPAELERLARDPLFQAAARVRLGLADCLVAGAVRTTADVLRAALWLIGAAPGVSAVSSFFLMVVPPRGEAPERVLLFADCGVQPDPAAEQLAEIGCLAADSFERLTGQPPHVAFLSFSTRGSADHARVRKVREAVVLARARRPDRQFDGELQADAALEPMVARRKAHDSAVAGRAEVLIFPDLDSGNIGYKLVERLAGAAAYGPVLQGLARQANDLSRGCSAEDVVEAGAIACALSGAPDGSSSGSIGAAADPPARAARA
jgi:phosphate acetyltransferase